VFVLGCHLVIKHRQDCFKHQDRKESYNHPDNKKVKPFKTLIEVDVIEDQPEHHYEFLSDINH